MKILLAVDCSHGSEELVAEVLQQAWPTATHFDVLHVSEPVHAWTQTLTAEALEAKAQEVVSDAVFSLSARGWSCERYFREGDAKKEILKFAEEHHPDLIVVGARRRSNLSRFLLGSVSTAVMRHAKCSVQVVRARAHDFRAERSYRVLLATDGSDQAVKAAEAIAKRPLRPGTEVRVVSVVELILPPTLTLVEPGEFGFPPDTAEFNEAKREAHGHSSLAAQVLSRSCKHVSEAIPVVSSGAKNAILEEAERWDADCIVVGSHGRSGVDRFLLGSVSEAVATHAKCSVEVVR